MEVDILRILFVFFSGYFLCLSGSLCQLVTNNNLASPSTLGMDGLVVLAVIASQVILVATESLFSLEILAFIIFFILFMVVYFYSNKKQSSKNIWQLKLVDNIVLLGLSFNLFVGAIFSILLFLFMAMNFEFPSGIWFGNFKQYQNQWLYLFLSIFIFSLYFLKTKAHSLALLNMGEDFSQGLGLNVVKIQKSSLRFSLLLTGTVIAFFGVFSFLGLVFPHIIRSFNFFKTNMERELKIGPVVCGVILSVIDFLCYNFTFMGAELPVGMVSGVIGSFFLIFLVFTSQVKSR